VNKLLTSVAKRALPGVIGLACRAQLDRHEDRVHPGEGGA